MALRSWRYPGGGHIPICFKTITELHLFITLASSFIGRRKYSATYGQIQWLLCMERHSRPKSFQALFDVRLKST
jgi:hypothetical protein